MRTYSLGEQRHFISADMKIPAMHPDVRLLVYNYRQPDRFQVSRIQGADFILKTSYLIPECGDLIADFPGFGCLILNIGFQFPYS